MAPPAPIYEDDEGAPIEDESKKFAASEALNTPPSKKLQSISLATAYVSLVKGNVGPGCLALPCVFGDRDAPGIYTTFIIMLWVGCISLYAPGLMIGAQKNLRAAGRDAETFEALAYHSIGRYGAILVQVFVTLLQIGICCVFLNYVGDNLKDGMSLHYLSFEGWVYASSIFALAISLGRSVKAFTIFTKMATFAMLIALISIAVFTCQKSVLSWDNDRFHDLQYWPPKEKPASKIALAFGNLAYTSATGICLILPIGNTLDPDDYGRRYLTVVRMALGTAITIFILLGVGVSMVFAGHKERNSFCEKDDSITAVFRNLADHKHNILPIPDSVLDVINAILIVAVLLTFPLQLHPAVEVLEKALNVGPMAANDNSIYREAMEHDELTVLIEQDRAMLIEPPSSPLITAGSNSINSGALARLTGVPLPPRTKAPLGGPYSWRLLRVLMVAVIATAAAFITRLTQIIALVGCLTSGTLGMILPVVIDYKIRKRLRLPISWRRVILGALSIASGVFAITVGNYYTILAISNPEHKTTTTTTTPPHSTGTSTSSSATTIGHYMVSDW